MPWIEASGVRMSIAVADRVTALAERPDHRGVVAVCDLYPYADAGALLARPDALVIALDGVTDPRNLGSIVRSCEWLGGHGLVIPRHGSAGVTAVVAKASAGAVGGVCRDRAGLQPRRGAAPQQARRPLELCGRRGRGCDPDELDLTGGVVLVLGSGVCISGMKTGCCCSTRAAVHRIGGRHLFSIAQRSDAVAIRPEAAGNRHSGRVDEGQTNHALSIGADAVSPIRRHS